MRLAGIMPLLKTQMVHHKSFTQKLVTKFKMLQLDDPLYCSEIIIGLSMSPTPSIATEKAEPD
jgi:hypothetical protein